MSGAGSSVAALPVVLDPPLKLLKMEFDSLAKVVADIDGQLATAVVQRARLVVVQNALENEMDRLRTVTLPTENSDPNQLELPLYDEVE